MFQEGRLKNCQGWIRYLSRAYLKKYCLTEGRIMFICAIIVVQDRFIPVPPSDIKEHFGKPLDSTDGTDVSFAIDGETFHAH